MCPVCEPHCGRASNVFLFFAFGCLVGEKDVQIMVGGPTHGHLSFLSLMRMVKRVRRHNALRYVQRETEQMCPEQRREGTCNKIVMSVMRACVAALAWVCLYVYAVHVHVCDKIIARLSFWNHNKVSFPEVRTSRCWVRFERSTFLEGDDDEDDAQRTHSVAFNAFYWFPHLATKPFTKIRFFFSLSFSFFFLTFLRLELSS